MMVEDHSYDYRIFEGIIPDGYSAGKVITWDEGLYELVEADGRDKIKPDEERRRGIYSGKVHMVLQGKKNNQTKKLKQCPKKVTN